MKTFGIVKELNLPKWKFAIFWSAILSLKNIRQSHDIDILVKKDLWDKLVKIYPDKIIRLSSSQDECISLNEKWIEIMKEWIHLYGKEEKMIDTAEIINWLPFVRIEYFREWKEKMGREKDNKDLELLSEYEKNQ